MMKKYNVFHEEFIDVFHDKFHIPKVEHFSFDLAHVRIIGSMKCGKTRNDCFHNHTTKK